MDWRVVADDLTRFVHRVCAFPGSSYPNASHARRAFIDNALLHQCVAPPAGACCTVPDSIAACAKRSALVSGINGFSLPPQYDYPPGFEMPGEVLPLDPVPSCDHAGPASGVFLAASAFRCASRGNASISVLA